MDFFPYLNHMLCSVIYHRQDFTCYIDVASTTVELYVCFMRNKTKLLIHVSLSFKPP